MTGKTPDEKISFVKKRTCRHYSLAKAKPDQGYRNWTKLFQNPAFDSK
jgi:hypothetical protein